MNCSTTRQIKEIQTCTMEVHAVKPWLVRMCSKCGLAIGRAPTKVNHGNCIFGQS